MNVLIVFAHPVPESFNASIFELVCRELKQGGHQVDSLDLYQENFQPSLSGEERRQYMGKDNTAHVERYVHQLKWADALVMVYPTWWMGPPAILKGWLDRVWLPSVVAEFGPDGVKPRLTNLRKILVITTQGSSWWRMTLIANPPRLMMKLCLKACTKCRDIQWLALYSMDKATESKLSRFLEKVRHRIQQFQ